MPFIIIAVYVNFIYIVFSDIGGQSPKDLGDNNKCKSIPGAVISCNKA